MGISPDSRAAVEETDSSVWSWGGYFELHPQVTWQQLGEETVVMSFSTGSFFALNETGGFIFQHLLSANHTPAQVLEALINQYDLEAVTARQDLIQCVTQLLTLGLLQPKHA